MHKNQHNHQSTHQDILHITIPNLIIPTLMLNNQAVTHHIHLNIRPNQTLFNNNLIINNPTNIQTIPHQLATHILHKIRMYTVNMGNNIHNIKSIFLLILVLLNNNNSTIPRRCHPQSYQKTLLCWDTHCHKLSVLLVKISKSFHNSLIRNSKTMKTLKVLTER